MLRGRGFLPTADGFNEVVKSIQSISSWGEICQAIQTNLVTENSSNSNGDEIIDYLNRIWVTRHSFREIILYPLVHELIELAWLSSGMAPGEMPLRLRGRNLQDFVQKLLEDTENIIPSFRQSVHSERIVRYLGLLAHLQGRRDESLYSLCDPHE